MAKPTTIKIRLNSSAGTGHFYVNKKDARTMNRKDGHERNTIPSHASTSTTKKVRSSKLRFLIVIKAAQFARFFAFKGGGLSLGQARSGKSALVLLS